MKTDRELLELAAKAAGWEFMPAGTVDKSAAGWLDPATGGMHWTDTWNPLADDGDAMRLAVNLHMDFYVGDDDGPAAFAGYFVGVRQKFMIEQHGKDPCAATRRAIVRAAAEIGGQIAAQGAQEGKHD